MTNVASLELCKELYELSGWDETEKWHDGYCDEPAWFYIDNITPTNKDTPAYDLGYLLRKIGDRHIRLERPYDSGQPVNRWGATYYDGTIDGYLIEADDTPEDAVCRLAIELIKQGVIPAGGPKHELQ